MTPIEFERERVAHWQHLAHTSVAEMHGCIRDMLALLQRLDQRDPSVLAAVRRGQGWTLNEVLTADSGPLISADWNERIEQARGLLSLYDDVAADLVATLLGQILALQVQLATVRAQRGAI